MNKISLESVPDCIMFDFDRTLIYLYEDETLLRILGQKIHDHYSKYLEIIDYENKDGYHVWHDAHREIVTKYKDSEAESINRAAEIIVTEFERNVAEEREIFPSTYKVIPYLYDLNITLGVVSSNSTEVVRAKLDSVGLGKYFKGIYGRILPFDPDQLKPDPYPILRAQSLLEMKTNSIWYVGDDLVDIAAAIGANVFPVGVATGRHGKSSLKNAGAELVVDDLDELRQIIERIRVTNEYLFNETCKNKYE